MSVGCAYFGVRIPRHVGRDMEELAALGYTAVLHTFSENDLAYYRGTMAAGAETSLTGFLGDLVAHVAARGGRNTVCLLPVPGDWDAVAALPGLEVLALPTLVVVGVGPNDAVVGVSAGGRTPYVLAALAAARAAGALTVALVCAAESPIAATADLEVVTPVGPEVIAGSTRTKAGTAQKLALNTISTVAMVQLGRTYGNLMVDVVASNEKLRNRARRAVAAATGVSDEAEALDAAGGEAKVVIIALLAGLDSAAARVRLESTGGALRKALVPVSLERQ